MTADGTRTAPVLALLAVLLAGCGGGAAAPAAPTPAAVAPTNPAAAAPAVEETCPPAQGEADPWPAGVPADLPVPPTAEMGAAEKSPDGLTLVRFTTSQSVRDGVLFLTTALQPAGYTLGRGDAEAIEADVPFSKGTLRGLLKMIAEQPCSTQWILALQTEQAAPRVTGAPLLPPVTSTSPSPLPFG